MVNFSNIKSIEINKADNSFETTHYNGSWHVIKHTASDNKDYSIALWELYYSTLDDMMDNYEIDEDQLTDEDYTMAMEYVCDFLEDCGIQLIKE